MFRNKKIASLLLIVLSAISIVFFSFLLFYCFFVYEKPIEYAKFDLKTKDYRYLMVNPLSNTLTNGFAVMEKDLGEDEFVSYHDVDGNHYLISNTGTDEYYCTGSCSCVDENLRRNSGALVQKGFVFLVAAFSSIFAVEKASDLFNKQCKKELSNVCSPDSISSDVESCDTMNQNYFNDVLYKEWEKEDEEEVEEKEVKSNEDLPDTRRYWCHGDCLVNKKLKLEEYLKLASDNQCESNSNDSEFNVECAGLSVDDCRRKARKTFLQDELDMYCQESSTKGVKYKTNTAGGFRWKEVTLCVGHYEEENEPVNDRTICVTVLKGQKFKAVNLNAHTEIQEHIYRPWGTDLED